MPRAGDRTATGLFSVRRWGVVLLSGLLAGSAAAQPPAAADIQEAVRALPAPRGADRSEIERAIAARDYARAEQLLADAAARAPASREVLVRIAGVFLLDRRPLNAAIALKKAEALSPLDDHERLQLALAYIALRRGDWARPELVRLTRSDPESPVYPYWLARLDYDDGRYAPAIDRLQEVVRLAPGFVRAHDNLGLCYEAQHRPEEALVEYREAVRLNRLEASPSAWPGLNLGILLRSRGETDEAERLFQEAVRYDPHFAQGYYQLGAVLEERGRLADAVEALRQSTAADADYPQPYYALARIYRRQGSTDKAAEALKTFKRLHDAGQAGGR